MCACDVFNSNTNFSILIPANEQKCVGSLASLCEATSRHDVANACESMLVFQLAVVYEAMA